MMKLIKLELKNNLNNLVVSKMVNLTNKDFINFLESYKDNNLFYDSVDEISRSHSGKKDSLINSSFKMYSLDEIVKESGAFGNNVPKTTDALWYKEDENGDFTLYIIEFKFYNIRTSYKLKLKSVLKKLNEINSVYEDYGAKNELFDERFLNIANSLEFGLSDNVHCSLKLKPIETLYHAIPELYKVFCGFDDDQDAEDCRNFLNKITKKFYVFLIEGSEISPNQEKALLKPKGKYNKSRNRAFIKGFPLHQQFIRYKHSNIIDDYKIEGRYDFNNFLKTEKLIEG